MKIKLILLSMLLLSGSLVTIAQQKDQNNADNQRMEWWREARFGMFIHWGLYTIPAGQWGEEKNHAEWIRETAKIPVGEYEKLLTQFNPVKFNADAWVKIAKDAGMKYIVLTSKHHDGFCLFDSKYTDFDVMNTPFKHDILRELADACRRQDMKICWYHSIMDWHHPDYLPRRGWEKEIRPEGDADFNRYFAYLKTQLTEIITNYVDISLLWFDGEWESTWNHQYATELFNYLRKLKPDMIINNRIDSYRDGMAGMSNNPNALGDYGTPEQEIPENAIPDKDWESCMTLNNHWGFNKFDNNWKSAKELIQNLADIASKGGNFLLNVGPTAEGLIPQPSIDRLAEMGKWIKVYGESVYGTKAGPFKTLSWGKCTQKAIGADSRLYFHLFNWPADHKIVINNLLNKAVKAYLLSDPLKKPIAFINNGLQIEIPLPDKATDPYNSVVVLEIKGTPQVINTPEFVYTYDDKTEMLSINLKSNIENEKLKIRYTLDGSIPDNNSPVFTQYLKINKTSEFKALAFYNDKMIGEVCRIKMPKSYRKTVVLKNEASEKYKANGAASLTDGNTGSKDFKDNTWLGFEAADFTATVDLNVSTAIHHIEINYLTEPRSWIFEPTEITVEISDDGINYKQIVIQKNNAENWNNGKGINVFSRDFEFVKARYVRFRAINRGICPAHHPGEGGKAWVFINEIVVD